MLKSLKWRLSVTFLIIVLPFLLIINFFLLSQYKEQKLQYERDSLLQEGMIITELIEEKGFGDNYGEYYQSISQRVSAQTNHQITIINQQGQILGASEIPPGVITIHQSHPEVFDALQGKTGQVIRYNEVEGRKILYLAVPVSNEDFQGVLRLAKSLEQMEKTNQNATRLVLLFSLLSGIIVFSAAFLVSRHLSTSLRAMNEAVEDISQGNFKRRVQHSSDDELGMLATSLNDMSQHLEQTIKEISEVKNRLEVVLNNTVNGVLMINPEGRIMYINPVAYALLGLEKDVADRPHVEVINNYELVASIDMVNTNMKIIQKEIVLHTLGEKVVAVNIIPVSNLDYDTRGVLVIINDITRIKKLEQIRKDFVANVSHELKTPVASISGFAETLLAESKNYPENIKEFINIIYEETQRLSRLINRLLELSRIESEKARFAFEVINLDECIRGAVKLVEKRAEYKDIKVNYQPPGEALFIKGDGDLIMQVIINLLDNAVKYSPEGDSVDIEVENVGKYYKVHVIDKGQGIPSKEIPRIFERFYRVDKARSRKTGGTGLGLAIVKHIVENHEGQVGVLSAPGTGSDFYFMLPQADQPDQKNE